MVPRAAIHVLLATMLAACSAKKDGSRRSAAESADASSRPSELPPAAASASSAAGVTAARIDLSKQGLPLTILVPACARITQPLVRIEETAKDLMLSCEPAPGDLMSAKRSFAIQIGLGATKASKKEIQEIHDFVRFTKTDPAWLEWESILFGTTVTEFLMRTTKGGVEYACFPQFATEDRALLAEQAAACRSIEAK